MKRLSMAVAAMLLAAHGYAQNAIEPTSNFFQVSDYYYPKPDGNYEFYQVAGYQQRSAPNVPATVFLLPTVTVKKEDVKFYRSNGTAISGEPQAADVGSITIKPTYVATMPTPSQAPAIAATLEGKSIFRYVLPGLKNKPFGSPTEVPVMAPEAAYAPHIRSAIEQAYVQHDNLLAEQKQLLDKYNSYQKHTMSLKDVEVRLLIGGEAAASRTYSGSVSTLGAITLMGPTEYQVNQVKEGNFEIEVGYRFRDTRLSTINATFDVKAAISSFVEETQKAITKSKSSGIQVFGIGSRKSKQSTSINQSMRTKDKIETIDRTSVVMYDATDEMVDRFESKFFPGIGHDEAVARHMEAAAQAAQAGNLELAKIHTDYADAIRQGDQMKEVDAVAAAAALNAGDYAGFLAHGVRAINSNNTKANNFRRLETRETVIDEFTEWNDTRIVSAYREVVVPVALEATRSYTPRIGTCSLYQNVAYTFVDRNMYGYPQPTQKEGLMVGCVEQDSPAQAAGLLPGMLVRFVNDQPVKTLADLSEAMSGYAPGDTIRIHVHQVGTSPQNPFSSDRLINIPSKRGPAL